jgi:hypothetical protein
LRTRHIQEHAMSPFRRTKRSDCDDFDHLWTLLPVLIAVVSTALLIISL